LQVRFSISRAKAKVAGEALLRASRAMAFPVPLLFQELPFLSTAHDAVVPSSGWPLFRWEFDLRLTLATD
jgi:hypothetical protein